MQDNIEVPEALEELRTTFVGAEVHDSPGAGFTLVDSVIELAKPLTLVTTMLEDPGVATWIVMDVGPADSVKSCTV